MNSLDIKKFRDRHNLTQSQLAELVGVKVGTVSKWEQGSRSIGQSAIKILESYSGENEKSTEIVKKEGSIEELIAKRVAEIVKKELKERDVYIEKVLKELMESIINLIPLVDQMSRKLDKIERDINDGKDLIRNKKM